MSRAMPRRETRRARKAGSSALRESGFVRAYVCSNSGFCAEKWGSIVSYWRESNSGEPKPQRKECGPYWVESVRLGAVLGPAERSELLHQSDASSLVKNAINQTLQHEDSDPDFSARVKDGDDASSFVKNPMGTLQHEDSDGDISGSAKDGDAQSSGPLGSRSWITAAVGTYRERESSASAAREVFNRGHKDGEWGTGTVRKWKEEKGYGFISADDAQGSILVHRTQLEGITTLTLGAKVNFQWSWNGEKKKYEGRHVACGAGGGTDGVWDSSSWKAGGHTWWVHSASWKGRWHSWSALSAWASEDADKAVWDAAGTGEPASVCDWRSGSVPKHVT